MRLSETLKQHAIPFSRPSIGEEEINSVVETLRSGWLTTGPKVKKFEKEFAARVGVEHAIAVSSCTAALHLALEAFGVGPGDEVIVPTLTFASTGEVVQHLGATPVLADILDDTLLIDPASIEAKITPRTKVIVPVHYAGQPCDMEEILSIASKHGLKVLEDAAHAYPAKYRDQTVGAIGDVTAFSFYANKTITTGEGGMVTTNNADLAARARLMSLHGITRDAWKRFSAEGTWDYEIAAPGFKNNMTDIAAALGLEQLNKAERLLRRREEIVAYYDRRFADFPAISTPVIEHDRTCAWHIYVIRLKSEHLTIDRNAFIKELAAAGIGSSVHYRPLHMHPLYMDRFGYRPEQLPVAQQVFSEIVSLPLFAGMSDADMECVADAVIRIVQEHSR